jgi:hypothetical protein
MDPQEIFYALTDSCDNIRHTDKSRGSCEYCHAGRRLNWEGEQLAECMRKYIKWAYEVED